MYFVVLIIIPKIYILIKLFGLFIFYIFIKNFPFILIFFVFSFIFMLIFQYILILSKIIVFINDYFNFCIFLFMIIFTIINPTHILNEYPFIPLSFFLFNFVNLLFYHIFLIKFKLFIVKILIKIIKFNLFFLIFNFKFCEVKFILIFYNFIF